MKWHATFADGRDRVRWNYRWGEQYGSFRSDLPDGVDRLLGGLLSEDWDSVRG